MEYSNHLEEIRWIEEEDEKLRKKDQLRVWTWRNRRRDLTSRYNDSISYRFFRRHTLENLSNGEALYGRPAQVNTEEWFNTALHWFAPKGQEIMEIYAKDLETGEKTQIKSYADFKEWKKQHPSND